MTSKPPVRRLLGTESSLADRCRVYRTADALEVDLVDHYDIRRRRVFFDEVELVTLHSRRGLRGGVAVFGLMALSTGVAWQIVRSDPLSGAILLGLTLGLAALAVAAAFCPVWIVTVFGKRTRARMRFNLRPGKARSVYTEMCAAAVSAQEALLSAEMAPSERPPGLPPPLPEPDSPP